MKVLISDLADKVNIKFGTSGLRGLVTDLTDEVCFAYTQAFLQSTPMLALLGLSKETKKPISKLTESLPKRFTASDRLQDIPTDKSQQLIASLIDNPESMIDTLLPNATHVLTIDQIDGLRVEFDMGDIVHLRPSGNAPELR